VYRSLLLIPLLLVYAPKAQACSALDAAFWKNRYQQLLDDAHVRSETALINRMSRPTKVVVNVNLNDGHSYEDEKYSGLVNISTLGKDGWEVLPNTSMEFHFDQDGLFLNVGVGRSEQLRNAGLYRLMYLSVLTKIPQITKLTAHLSELNSSAFLVAFHYDMTPESFSSAVEGVSLDPMRQRTLVNKLFEELSSYLREPEKLTLFYQRLIAAYQMTPAAKLRAETNFTNILFFAVEMEKIVVTAERVSFLSANAGGEVSRMPTHIDLRHKEGLAYRLYPDGRLVRIRSDSE